MAVLTIYEICKNYRHLKTGEPLKSRNILPLLTKGRIPGTKKHVGGVEYWVVDEKYVPFLQNMPIGRPKEKIR